MAKNAYFLPFTPLGRETELTAIRVKQRLGLGAYESVDPFEALQAAAARLVTPEELARLPYELRSALSKNNGDFSAVGLGRSPVTGLELIILNEAHHPHRRKATLMEEIVHVVLNHPRSELTQGASGSWTRTYDDDGEDEAFRVGAACIIPYRWLFNHIKAGWGKAEIAAHFGVSEDYVGYRIQRAGLFRMFNARAS